jgi:hypothetical protein
MDTEASITVNQAGVQSFAAALWSAQEYEIFVDDRQVGVLNGYQNRKTCALPSGPHSIYVRAYARDSATVTRIYGYSQTVEVTLSPGENKLFSCGIVKGPPLRKALVLTASIITILLFLGLGPIGRIPEHTRYASILAFALITIACSWFGYSSKPGASIYLTEA